jgi:hypothetical protein
MSTAVWCLFTFIGAWATLRHTPFYTLKSALRVVGLTVLMLGAVAGVIFVTARSVEGRSMTVQTTALASMVILCTLGLIFGVSKVSTPAGAELTTRLPPNVRAVTLYRARILPWARAVGMVLGASLLLMLVPGPVHYIVGSFAAIAAFLAMIMLPTAYVTARRVDRAVTALQLHPWVHWHYPSDAWNAWSARLADREAMSRSVTMTDATRRRTITVMTVLTGLYAAYLVPASAMLRVASGVAAGLLVLGIALLTRSQSRHASQRLAARLRTAPPDTYFGSDGVFCNGEFCAWRAVDAWLLSASVEAGPPRCVELWFEKVQPAAYGSVAVTKVRKEVLIAADAAASDLSALQAALVARCPDAAINLA